jgi:hypothetical protein
MKKQQKQHLIDMMKADEELGLYDTKQTAVEWLYERLERMIPRTALYNIDKEEYFNKAKEMEKEQLKKVWMDAQTDQCKQFSSNYSGITFDEYLEIYKKEKGL